MSRTRKPCPGCGEVDPHRPADKVCARCRDSIQFCKKFREAPQGEVYVDRIDFGRFGEDVVEAIKALCYLIGEVDSFKGSLRDRVIRLPQPIADQINKLIACLQSPYRKLQDDMLKEVIRVYGNRVGNAVFTAGVRAGLDFLKLLATGQASLADLEEFRKRPFDSRKVHVPGLFLMSDRTLEFLFNEVRDGGSEFDESDYVKEIEEYLKNME